MKLLKNVFWFVLSCTLLAGCAPNPETVIQNVIISFYEAGFNWDYQTLKDSVIPEYPVYDPNITYRNTHLQNVQQGFMVEEDVEQFMALDREFDKKRGENMKFHDWNIEVLGNTASVVVANTGAGVDFENLRDENGELAYRDDLFFSICGMDESTAKETLSPEEFSSVHLRVQKQEYELWLANLSDEDVWMKIQLEKTGGIWRIASVLPVSEK